MITAGGLFTGYLVTHGFGSWEYSTAEDMDISFGSLKYAVANFQISRYNIEVESIDQPYMTIRMK